MNAAVEAAKRCTQGWRLTPAPKRGEILFRVAELLVKRKEDYSRDMTREMGKVLAEARGDVQEAIDMTYYMAGEGPEIVRPDDSVGIAEQICDERATADWRVRNDYPWNFPMAIPSWKMIPALVCGNTVVMKPAEDTPLSTYHLVETMIEAGIPAGVVNLVNGDGPGAGAAISCHEDVPSISFTGSTSTGRIIAENCAPTFKHYSLEMGGKNIIMVMEDANLDLAVEGAVWGGFGTTGQRCTAASRVAVHKDGLQGVCGAVRGACEEAGGWRWIGRQGRDGALHQ